MSYETFGKLSWNITEPLSKIKQFDKKQRKFVPASRDILDKKINIPAGMRIVILNYDRGGKLIPVLMEPVCGKTIIEVMACLKRGLQRLIKPGDRHAKNFKKGDYYFEPSSQKYPFPTKNQIVYDKISGYFDSKTRLRLIKKYEAGKLTPSDLFGDHIHFEGFIRRGKYLEILVGS